MLKKALQHLEENPTLYDWNLSDKKILERYEYLQANPKVEKQEKKENNKLMLDYCTKMNLWYLAKMETAYLEEGEKYYENKKDLIEILTNLIERATNLIERATSWRKKLEAHQELEDYTISDEKKEAEKRVTNKIK